MNSEQATAKNFIWLNATQFLGALNDNILKLLIIFYLIGSHGKGSAGIITATVGAAFVLPFLLFSAPAGSLADRLAKSKVIAAVKVAEVAVTALAVAAFALGIEKALYLTVFLMATHSAFFAPAKYGAIPEMVAKEELSRANGMMEASTFLAIILGTALASVLTELSGGHIWIASLLCLGVALAGLCSARRIATSAPAAAPRPVALFPMEILRTIKGIKDRHLMLAILGLAYFMFIAAFAQLNLISFGMERLGLSDAQSGYLFLAAAMGIGIGSLLAAKLSGRDVEFGIVPIGAAGLTVAPMLLHFTQGSLCASVAIIVGFGISAGLFSLPLQTFIQFKADPAQRGELLAASSFINWAAIMAASALTWLFTGPLSLSAAQGFAVIGATTLVLTVISLRVLPDFLLRFIALLMTRLCYRIRVNGSDQLPTEGAALLIPNHVTWVDAFLLSATTQRRIRFVMERSIYNKRLLNPLFRLMQVIPVSSGDGRKEILQFVKEARAALDDGYLVCIFAEGALTRNGMLQEFRGGFERIVKGSSHPILPVYIGGAWGSVLSYAHGKLLSRLPASFPYPVSIHFGKPMPASSQAAEVRQKVAELSCD